MRLSTLLLFAIAVAYLIDPGATKATLLSIWRELEGLVDALASQRNW
ncbi:hypothetical protein GGD83_004068 [Rhodoblastus sphagnicola]|nr:hypothetical protein [Rhodoblastus sphagnicola]MBB4200240.1 hypothetical protein [Rhodoblastus sphagnicola]